MWTAVVLTSAIAGCQVRGLIGSNESAADGETAESGTARDPALSGTGGNESDDSVGTGGASGSGGHGSSPTHGEVDESSSGGELRFDVPPRDDPGVCAPPTFPSCDDGPADALGWHQVLGLCHADDDATYAQATLPGAVGMVRGRVGGELSPFSPREGDRMLVLSTGDASEFEMSVDQLRARHPLKCRDPLLCPSSNLGGPRREGLPDPIDWRPVHEHGDCSDEPGLVGSGDCSNSLVGPWTGGDGAFDYSELRMRAQVPRFTDALAFDFAFFSSEYPVYTEGEHATPYNDMFIAWLESEAWTGNVSFDDGLRPITAQSVFMDYRSASESCPHCTAPELTGFSMERHGGTKWLNTKAPVVPGETLELVFAIFDLSDSSLDSVVLLDGFEWSCSSSRPVTTEG